VGPILAGYLSSVFLKAPRFFDAAAPISYFVKPLEMEQRMAEAADPSSCDALTLKTYTLPDLAAWVDPNIGEEPVVEGPPAVIGGVLQ